MKPLKNQPRYTPHTRGGYHESSTVVMRGVRWDVLKNVGFTQLDIYDEKKEFCHICINYKIIGGKYHLNYGYIAFFGLNSNNIKWVNVPDGGYKPIYALFDNFTRRDFFALVRGLVAFMRADKF